MVDACLCWIPFRFILMTEEQEAGCQPEKTGYVSHPNSRLGRKATDTIWPRVAQKAREQSGAQVSAVWLAGCPQRGRPWLITTQTLVFRQVGGARWC